MNKSRNNVILNTGSKFQRDLSEMDPSNLRHQNGMLVPPGLPLTNRFEALADEHGQFEREVGNLEVLMPSPVAEVARTGQLVSAGKGKITIDSGAAESVMPRDMLISSAISNN